jgi:OmpR family response regulator RpaB
VREDLSPSSRASQTQEKVLIVDDEASIRRILETRFQMLGFEVATADNGESALALFSRFEPDIVILDIMTPNLDGYGVIREIRRQCDTPIIILSALSSVAERIAGLELGTDDYVVKPFSPKELEARVRCILRRLPPGGGASVMEDGIVDGDNPIVTIAHISIDRKKRQVFKRHERVRLTGMEFSLLEFLAGNPGQAFSRQELLQLVWSYPPEHRIDTRVIDVHISRLRAKLEIDMNHPELILTSRGVGYMLCKPE